MPAAVLAEEQRPRTIRERPVPWLVHQRIRFLVERRIRTRIPPSVRGPPLARAAPGATIIANLQTVNFTTPTCRNGEEESAKGVPPLPLAAMQKNALYAKGRTSGNDAGSSADELATKRLLVVRSAFAAGVSGMRIIDEGHSDSSRNP